MLQLNKPAFLVLFIVFGFCSLAQQMVQTPMDIFLACQKDNEFIGKPLKTLLSEIKPPIKMVFAEGGWAEQAPQFAFYFMSYKEFDKYRSQGRLPLRIRVYVKEFFKWPGERRNRDKEHFLGWTQKDIEEFGNLTITAIRVGGEYEPCEEDPKANL